MRPVSHETLTACCSHHPCRFYRLLDLSIPWQPEATLEQAARSAGIEVKTLLDQLDELPAHPTDASWRTAPLAAIIAYLLEDFHAPLRRHLAELAEAAYGVALLEDDPVVQELSTVLYRLQGESDSHLNREEQRLFPWILGTRSTGPDSPVQELREDHDHHGVLLERLRQLASRLPTNPNQRIHQDLMTLSQGIPHLLAHFDGHLIMEEQWLFPRALAELNRSNRAPS